MPYFETRNANNANIIQIDDTFNNLRLRQTGTYSTQGQWRRSRVRYSEIHVWGSDPAIAIRSDVGVLLLERRPRGDGAFIFTLLFNTTVDINYQFWIYDDWPEQDAEQYLVIKRSDGHTIYNANSKYMKVYGVLQGSGGVSMGLPRDWGYAVMLGFGGLRLDVVSGNAPTPGWWLEVINSSGSFTRIVGAGVYVDGVTIYNIRQDGDRWPPPNSPGGTNGTNNVYHLVIDVWNH